MNSHKFGTFAAMARYFLHLAYKGTNYNGWQVQPNAPSVQGTIEKCISTMLRDNISVVGAGRTDTGVHARNFYAHFDAEHTLLNNSKDFVYKLNRFLPRDIVILDLINVHDNAHTRFDASSRKYKYYISLKKEIFQTDYCWQYNFDLDIAKMNQAAKELFNHTDFTSFSKLHTDVKTNNCKITEAFWEINDNMVVFTIAADRFLRNMVRSIVGTLLEIGLNKKSLEDFREIILAKDRNTAGTSVPAQGLFLEEILYPFI